MPPRRRDPVGETPGGPVTSPAPAGLPRPLADGTPLADARSRARFLLEATEVLRGSPVLEESLAAFARFAVPALADWVAIDLAEDGGVLHRVAVAHAAPARTEAARGLEGRYTVRGEAPWGPLRAARKGRALYFPHILDARILATVDDPAHLVAVRELGLGAVLCLPLMARGPIHGVLSCVRVVPRQPFVASELAACRLLATRLGETVLHGRLVRDLQAASRAKDQFIAMLGHELRNPIAAVRQAVSALERLGPRDAPTTGLHGLIDRQTRHLARLVDDLLDVARLTSGRIALRREPVDLREAVERCLATLAGVRRVHDVAVDGERVMLDADPTRLDQIVGNLLDNALKYTAPGGRIGVTVGRAHGVGRLSVRDTGIGMAPEALARIFEPFAQAEQPLARERGGLGMGLTLVHGLVELHGGRMVTSPGPGQGTAVEVWLPLATSASTASAPAEPRPLAAAGGRHRAVLVVEDNADAREALRWLLESEGHSVRTARSWREAIELTLQSSPDVALVDIGLPEMDGYELARHLRATPRGAAIRLVALTGYGRPEDRRRAQEAGFEVHLVKPIEPDDLMRLLASELPARQDLSA
jgi:signal transduction histidine kinase/ActR/RegA family two-component response regulator